MKHNARALGGLLDLLLADQSLERNDFMREVFVRLRALTSFSSAIFMPVDSCSWEMRPGLSFELDDAPMAEYLQFFAPFDPMLRNGPTPTSVNQVFRFSDVAAGVPGWQRNFADFMDRVPYRHALASLVATPTGPLGALAIHRTARERDFDASDQELFARVVRCMARGTLWRECSTSATPCPMATLLIEENGRVLWMNETAERLTSATHLDLRRLCRLRSEGVRLETSLGTFLIRAKPLARNSLYLRYAAAACPGILPAAARAGNSRPQPAQAPADAYILTLSLLAARSDTAAAFAEMGLTPAESRVAGGIVRGLAIKQIAQALGVEQGTVKKHATHIYQKAHVRSRADLAACVTGLKAGPGLTGMH